MQLILSKSDQLSGDKQRYQPFCQWKERRGEIVVLLNHCGLPPAPKRVVGQAEAIIRATRRIALIMVKMLWEGSVVKGTGRIATAGRAMDSASDLQLLLSDWWWMSAVAVMVERVSDRDRSFVLVRMRESSTASYESITRQVRQFATYACDLSRYHPFILPS
jgi:hypothetical protein